MKYKQPHPGFELSSPYPFPMTLTITPWSPPNLNNVDYISKKIIIKYFYAIKMRMNFNLYIQHCEINSQDLL